MFTILFTILAAILFCFSFVLLVGAPYVPTLNRQVEVALDLIDLNPGETLLELGCGDGKVLIAAAKRGLKAVGYELNPIMAAVAWLRTRRYRGQVRVICADFWRAEWPPAEGIFIFLLPKHMLALDKKIMQNKSPKPKLVSFAFVMPGREIIAQKDNVHLYQYE